MGANMKNIDIAADLRNLGIRTGDTVLIRVALQSVGRIPRSQILTDILEAVGSEGTIACLAFTDSAYRWRADKLPPFTVASKSNAGALPNIMLGHPDAHRSLHPQCSIVAIGKHAEFLTSDHGPKSPAYAPMRKVIDLQGKMLVIGCVKSCPGFTTAHLAEFDLKLYRRFIMTKTLTVTPYINDQGERVLYKRSDPGLCSNSYWKFYAHYVNDGLLRAGMVGDAYSVVAPAKECYAVEHAILARDPQFNICDEPLCATCNALRWDRIHHAPIFAARKITRFIRQRLLLSKPDGL